MFKQTLFTTLALLTLNPVFAAPADVAETGQTTCFDTAGAPIACTGTGQDGELRAGVAAPSPRFVVGSGAQASCVTDRLTGLMWMRAPDNVTRTWADALTYADGLTLCGFTDWRLPNVNELESLVNMDVAVQASALNAAGFSGVIGDFYWSSTSYAGAPDNAWLVGMNDGGVVLSTKAGYGFVWPVRAGQ